MEEILNRTDLDLLAEKIIKADAIIIGGGSGISSAAGYNHYHWMPYMENKLKDFKEWYGLESPFAGFYFCYASPEQQWAYYARYIGSMLDAPVGQPYLDLQQICTYPSIIKLPFWEMTYKNENTFYACMNQKQSSAPEHIKEKSVYIAGDLAATLGELKEYFV